MIKMTLKNGEALANKIKSMGKEVQNNVQAELNAWADDVATDAKQLVASNSSDEGGLLRSIYPIYGDMYSGVVASARYAAYIEFGTRKFAADRVAQLPDTWQQLAAQSKGSSGGTFKELLESITAWCKRKGIDEAAAYPIAKKILINGIRPRPFLYPSVNANTPDLMKRLQKLLK